MGLIKSVWDAAWDAAVNHHLSRKVKSGQVVELPDARYESAFPFFRKRSFIPGTIQDARLDATPGVRRELLKNSRYWERNNPYFQKIIHLSISFTVGATGLRLVPNSSDEEFNEIAGKWWRKFEQRPTLDTFHPMATLQSLMVRCFLVEGESFIIMAKDKTGRPALQMVDAHRVETPGDKDIQEGVNIIDGVEIDDAGLPIAYYVRQRDVSGFYGQNSLLTGATQLGYTLPGAYARIDAENMLHLFEPVRPGLTRGLPALYACERILHDLDDLQDYEMQKAKENARTAKVVNTVTGEAPTTQNKYRINSQISSQNAAGNTFTKPMPEYYEQTFGGDVAYLMPNEKMEVFQNDQPSAATQAYWEQNIGAVCISVGVPRVLVVPYSLQGTVLRADIEAAAAHFRTRSTRVGHTMFRAYKWAMEWAIDYDKMFRGVKVPSDWDSVAIRPPRSVNVDVGRNSAALISEYYAGFRTLAEVCSELGTDWREVQDEKDIEWARAKRKSDKSGVPVERIMEPPKPTAPPAPAQDGEEDEEEEESKPAKNGNGGTNGRFDFRNGHDHALLTH